MTTRTVLAGVLVKDWAGAQGFWTTMFDRAPDEVPMHGCAEWRVPGGGVLQLVEDATRAGSSSVTLAVDDVRAERDRLVRAEVTVPEVWTVPGFIDAVTFSDPEGTQVTLVEPIAPQTAADVVRALFAAYRDQDAAAATALLAEDFVFTSPQDEPIGRDEWLRRCFPTADRMRTQDLVDVVEVSPGEVFVRYVYELHSGARHRNTEVLTVRDGRVTETQVYFGAALA
jgi:ketosteroid isomerase-like protein/predicted enzyme related to lactoylglutathione lyase